MAFQAARAVVDLIWDLRPYVEAHGAAPEPSQARIEGYERGMMEIYSDYDLELTATASEEEIDAEVQRIFTSQVKGMSLDEARPKMKELAAPIYARRIEAASEVCGGAPTVEQLTELRDKAPRVCEAFLGWVAGWAADPTVTQDATSP